MPTPEQRIRAGLDELDANTPSKLAKFAKAPSEQSDFATLMAAVKRDYIGLRVQAANAAEKRKAHEARTVKKWDGEGWEVTDKGRIDRMGATARQKFVNGDLASFEKSQIKDNEAERAPKAERLREAQSHLRAAHSQWGSPVDLLALNMVGNPKVLDHFQAIQFANVNTLQNMAILAAQKPDPELMQAIIMRTDAMDSSDRSGLTFSKFESALAVVGTEWKQIFEMIAITDYMVGLGLLADKELSGKKVSSTDRIGIGLAMRDAEKAIGKRLVDDSGEIITPDKGAASTPQPGDGVYSASNREKIAAMDAKEKENLNQLGRETLQGFHPMAGSKFIEAED